MIVRYEFDLDNPEKNDRYELHLVVNAYNMYDALTSIQDYMRTVRKGWVEADIDQIDETICEFIGESRINEIE